MTDQQKKFDAIVVGSGIGGLTVAALLAKQKKRVLVLEQHFTAGGFTHGFERKGKFHWDVGLHYVGEMGEGSPYRSIFDYLTNKRLLWKKMPQLFDKFVYPDFSFAVDALPQKYQDDLISTFPSEAIGIKRYFGDVQKAATWFILHALLELLPTFIQPLLKRALLNFGKLASQNTQDYLDKNFQDVQLKALLTSQWGDYGLPPSRSCFGIHSLVVTHYFGGGWYPVGGGSAIAPAMISTIEQANGQVITQRRVTQILIESGIATGVQVQNVTHPDQELTYHAPMIVSDAGVFNTYLKLIPQDVPLSDRESIRNFPKGSHVFTLYVGLKESAQKLGFAGENHWIYSTYDHDEIHRSISSNLENSPQFCYLSFPSLKNPESKGHTAEIIAAANYDHLLAWQDKTWRKRGTDYIELKSRITDLIIQFIESRYPGFQDLIEYVELSTPLTVEHFNASDRGSIYGIPCVPERLEQPWIAAKTPIKNLYLTGSDTFAPGIVGAMMGGVKTACLMNGQFGFLKIMANITRGYFKNLWKASPNLKSIQLSKKVSTKDLS